MIHDSRIEEEGSVQHLSEPLAPETREQSRRRYRDIIMEAALDVFSEKGYAEAQMGEIALRAQVAVGTLYNFFSSKENLYKEMLMGHFVDFAVAFSEIFESDDDPYSKVVRYVRFKGELCQSHPKLTRLYFSEVRASEMNVRATSSKEFRRTYNMMLGQLAEVFQSGIEQGIFVSADPFALAVSLASITNSFVMLWMNHPDKYSYPERIDSILQIFFGPVLKGEVPSPLNAGDPMVSIEGDSTE